MSYEWLIAVSMFALVASISPGPVNMLAMNAGVNKKVRAGLFFVLGATVGFCSLLFISGTGLQSLFETYPSALIIIKWMGVVFIAWIAWKLWQSDGSLGGDNAFEPTFVKGVLIQWLNPKAWLASLSIVGLYAPKDTAVLSVMTGMYFVICFLSICSWLVLGKVLTLWIDSNRYLQLFNKGLAVILVVSLIYLLF